MKTYFGVQARHSAEQAFLYNPRHNPPLAFFAWKQESSMESKEGIISGTDGWENQATLGEYQTIYVFTKSCYIVLYDPSLGHNQF